MHLARVADFHLTDLPERHLEETPADAVELARLAGADEAVVAAPVLVVAVESVGAQFWVDMDSIQVENGITRFRTRVLAPNTPGYAYADSVADCAAKTAEMRHLEIVRDGKVVGSKDFEPGSGVQSLDDEQGKALSVLICPS